MFNVIICGVVKNAAKYLKENIERALLLGSKCNKYKIVIYENNSTDGTKSILNSYANIHILSEDIDQETIKKKSKIWAYTKITGSDHPCRIEQIANARNKLIDELHKSIYDDYNYVVMIDLDSKNYLVEGIMDSLRLVGENRKRVIYANSEKYYDYYALRSAHSDYNLFGPELMGEYFWKVFDSKPLQIDPISTDLVPVYSAFNGIGVYAREVFTSHFFDALLTPAVKIIYEKLAADHPTVYTKYKKILQGTCPKFTGGERDELFYWKNNSGYDKPLVCEHIAYNFALLNDGCEITINPRMLYWWS